MFKLDQKIAFYNSGYGRGGHVVAFGKVTKINKKTIVLEELPGSYAPGTIWRCHKNWIEEKLCRHREYTERGYNVFD